MMHVKRLSWDFKDQAQETVIKGRPGVYADTYGI